MKDESAYFIIYYMVLYYYFTYFYLLTLLQKAIATTIVIIIMGLRLTVSYICILRVTICRLVSGAVLLLNLLVQRSVDLKREGQVAYRNKVVIP